MVASPNECDLRYLEFYEQEDNKRSHKLKVTEGDGVLERSVTKIKGNFSERVKTLIRKTSLRRT